MSGERLYPALGWLRPMELGTRPEYAVRWQALIDALAAAGIAPDEWPFRAEGLEGHLRHLGFMVLLSERGEGAVLDELERQWRGSQPRPGRAIALADLERVRDGNHAVTKAQAAAQLAVSEATVDRVLQDEGTTWFRFKRVLR